MFLIHLAINYNNNHEPEVRLFNLAWLTTIQLVHQMQ